MSVLLNSEAAKSRSQDEPMVSVAPHQGAEDCRAAMPRTQTLGAKEVALRE